MFVNLDMWYIIEITLSLVWLDGMEREKSNEATNRDLIELK